MMIYRINPELPVLPNQLKIDLINLMKGEKMIILIILMQEIKTKLQVQVPTDDQKQITNSATIRMEIE